MLLGIAAKFASQPNSGGMDSDMAGRLMEHFLQHFVLCGDFAF